jgi:uncharacterized protein YeaO (DUF488 family)
MTSFQSRYSTSSKRNKEQVAMLKEKAAKGSVTLPFAAKDKEHNKA